MQVCGCFAASRTGEEEVRLLTQDAAELVGDTMEAQRALGHVVAAFEARDFTPSAADARAVVDEAVVPGRPREDVRARKKRGRRRRNIRLLLAAVAGPVF